MKTLLFTLTFFFYIPIRRKTEVMMSNGLFSLMTERLVLHSNHFTMTTYNVLFEVHLLIQLSTTIKSSTKGLLMENNTLLYAAFSLFK